MELLTDGRQKCEQCRRTFTYISQHYSKSDCTWPSPSDDVQEIFTGMVLSGAPFSMYTSASGYESGNIQRASTNRELLEWIDEQIGFWGNGVGDHVDADDVVFPNNDNQGETRSTYRLHTVRCPWFKERYGPWVGDGRRQISEPFELTPAMVHTWYALNGSMSTYSKTDEERINLSATLFTESVDDLVKCFEMTDGCPTPKVRKHTPTYESRRKSVELIVERVAAVERFKNFVLSWDACDGEPLPGCSHKF